MASFVCSNLKHLLWAFFEDNSWFYIVHFHVTFTDSKQESGNNSNENMSINGIRMCI